MAPKLWLVGFSIVPLCADQCQKGAFQLAAKSMPGKPACYETGVPENGTRQHWMPYQENFVKNRHFRRHVCVPR
jgi:hypothetical protein